MQRLLHSKTSALGPARADVDDVFVSTIDPCNSSASSSTNMMPTHYFTTQQIFAYASVDTLLGCTSHRGPARYDVFEARPRGACNSSANATSVVL